MCGKGAVRHEDFEGHKGTIEAGDLQWMTAGRGIVHSEMPASEGTQKGLQLWINLSSKYKMSVPLPHYNPFSFSFLHSHKAHPNFDLFASGRHHKSILSLNIRYYRVLPSSIICFIRNSFISGFVSSHHLLIF